MSLQLSVDSNGRVRLPRVLLQELGVRPKRRVALSPGSGELKVLPRSDKTLTTLTVSSDFVVKVNPTSLDEAGLDVFAPLQAKVVNRSGEKTLVLTNS